MAIPEAPLYVGVDVGGTKILASLTDEPGQIMASVKNATPHQVDGEEVPYIVTENAGVCSSCAEFFNVVEDGSRKLVRACPGSVIFGGAERNVYLDVKPVQILNS